MEKKAIHKAFKEYVKAAEKVLCKPAAVLPSTRAVRLAYISPATLLLSLVKRIESSEKFGTLAKALKVQSPARRVSQEMKLILFPESALAHFFRRSGLYQRLFESKKVQSDDYFEILWSALAGDMQPIRTNFTLISARFERSLIDFGDFSIRKFTPRMLEKLTGNQINKVFYPEAVVNAELLSNYWFLTWRRRGTENLIWDRPDTPIPRTFLAQPIQWIALHNWLGQPKQHFAFGSLGLLVPFSFTVDEDFLSEPMAPHPLCQVREFPLHLLEADAFYGRKLKESHVSMLQKTVRMASEINQVVAGWPKWDFINLAMGYLAKALTTEDKLEQILWNVCVLESLFGASDRKDITNTIRKRVSTFLSRTQAQEADLIRQFNKIYQVRCDLVHSNSFDKKPTFETVVSSRELARRALLWFVEFLRVHKISPKQYPKRSDLLNWMDKQIEQQYPDS